MKIIGFVFAFFMVIVTRSYVVHSNDAFDQSEELLEIIEQVQSGELMLDDDEWDELLDEFPNESPLQQLALTCRECKPSLRSVALDLDERYQEIEVPFGAVSIHLHTLPINRSHHVFVNDICIFNATTYSHRLQHQPMEIGDTEIPVHIRLLLQHSMHVVVKVVSNDLSALLDIYWLELDREVEPPCGWLVRTQSKYQNISLYKGDQERDDPVSSIYECYKHFDSQQRFLLPHQMPHIEQYQMILNDVIQTDLTDHLTHAIMVRYPLMYAKNLKNILIIGGGDAQAAKEFLKFPELLANVDNFVNIELDGVLVDVWKNHPLGRHLSNNAYNDPRLTLMVGDGIKFLLESNIKWDIIIDDCEVEVSKQPKTFQQLYEKYERALVLNLAEGGIAQVMQPLDWNLESNVTTINVEELPRRQRYVYMRRLATRLEMARDWTTRANYIMSQVVDGGSVGPEQYIFMANEPFVKHRHVPINGFETSRGAWSERPLYTTTYDMLEALDDDEPTRSQQQPPPPPPPPSLD